MEWPNVHQSTTVVMCGQCHLRTGTERWIGEGGMMAVTHGWYAWWCEWCVLDAQIEYAEKQSAGLADLRAARAALDA